MLGEFADLLIYHLRGPAPAAPAGVLFNDLKDDL